MTISFTGFLALKDNKDRDCTLNTNNITGIYKEKDSDDIKIASVDSTSVTLSGFKYAEVQKGLIEADNKGFFELKKTDEKTPLLKEVKEDCFIPPVLDKPVDGKPADDIFSYIEQKDGIKAHCPNSLEDLNCALRQNRDWVLKEKETQNLIKTCDLAFEKLPPLDKETVFYRGTYGVHLPDEILNSKIGDIITPDKGYAQVGLNQYTAEKYLPGENFKPVLFKMICPKGAKVSYTEPKNTGNGYQKEGMMPRAQKFKVLKKEKEDITRTYPSWNNSDKIIEEKIPTTVFTLEYVL